MAKIPNPGFDEIVRANVDPIVPQLLQVRPKSQSFFGDFEGHTRILPHSPHNATLDDGFTGFEIDPTRHFGKRARWILELEQRLVPRIVRRSLAILWKEGIVLTSFVIPLRTQLRYGIGDVRLITTSSGN